MFFKIVPCWLAMHIMFILFLPMDNLLLFSNHYSLHIPSLFSTFTLISYPSMRWLSSLFLFFFFFFSFHILFFFAVLATLLHYYSSCFMITVFTTIDTIEKLSKHSTQKSNHVKGFFRKDCS